MWHVWDDMRNEYIETFSSRSKAEAFLTLAFPKDSTKSLVGVNEDLLGLLLEYHSPPLCDERPFSYFTRYKSIKRPKCGCIPCAKMYYIGKIKEHYARKRNGW